MNVISFLENINDINKKYIDMNKNFNKKNLGTITKTKYKKDQLLHFSNINDPFTLTFKKKPKFVDLNKEFQPIKNWNDFIKMHVIGPYISHSYRLINNLIKTDNIVSDYYYLLISLILNKIIHKFSETKQLTVYRGIRPYKLMNYKEKGSIIKENRYISTSTNPIVAYNFYKPDSCCYFVIKITKGVKYIPTSMIQSESREAEILIARNTEFIVDEIKDNFIKLTALESDKLQYDVTEILLLLREFVSKIAKYNEHFNPYLFYDKFINYENDIIKIKQKYTLNKIINQKTVYKKIFTKDELNEMKEFVDQYL